MGVLLDLKIRGQTSLDVAVPESPGMALSSGAVNKGGTSDYKMLVNKPSIESVVLTGDKPIKTWVDTLTPQDIDEAIYG